MPRIDINGVSWPSVSTELVGKRTPDGTEVTLVAVRDGAVMLAEHDLLLEFAAEVLAEGHMALDAWAEQVLAPHPISGKLVEVFPFIDHDKGRAKLALAQRQGARVRLYEWYL